MKTRKSAAARRKTELRRVVNLIEEFHRSQLAIIHVAAQVQAMVNELARSHAQTLAEMRECIAKIERGSK